jgi:CrcB protein
MLKLTLIFVGSGLGGVLRYALSGCAQKLAGGMFPLGTLVVNVTGCLLIGFLSAAFAGRLLIREEYRIGLLVGVLGGYTTFSAFGFETFSLLNDGQYLRASANVVLSVVVGLIGVWAGYRLAENWLGV